MLRAMVKFGRLATWIRAGRRIRPDAGSGSPITVGHGFRMSPGAGRRITTAAGSLMADRGAGGRDLSMSTIVLCGRRLMCSSLVSDTTMEDLDSVLVPSAGCRLVRLILSMAGTDAALAASMQSPSLISASMTIMDLWRHWVSMDGIRLFPTPVWPLPTLVYVEASRLFRRETSAEES